MSGALAQRKRLALLAILAATPAGLSRETIVAMLWPESDDERARNSLSQVLHALRREISERVIQAPNGALVLDLDVVGCDVVDFRAAVARSDHATAVALYRGPFLDGVYLRDTPAFERWCDDLRLELGRQYLASLQYLAEDATRRCDRAGAVDWWRRCANADPLSGRIARQYMDALVAHDQREEAIRHSEVHRELVRSELGAEPDRDVASFAEKLRSVDTGLRRVAEESAEPVVPRHATENVATASPQIPTTADVPKRRDGRRKLRYAGVGALVLAAGTFAAIRLTTDRAADARRVVVAAFDNRTGDASLDQLGFMTADLIAQALQHTNLTSVVDPTTATAASRNARSEKIPLGDAREVRLMASETRARLVVTGSYYRDGDTLVMLARVSDSQDEKLLDGLPPIRVSYRTPAAVVAPIRERVLGALAMRLDPRLDPIVPPGSTTPPTFTAYQEFMQGLAAFQRSDRRAARNFFTSSAAADSTFALPLIWKVWIVGENSPSGDSLLRRLESMRARLTPLDRIALDYQRATVQRDNRGKLTAALEAVRLAPGSHWAHDLGGTLTVMGRFDEAIAAYDQIDRRKGWTRGWITYWERFTVALHLAGNHARELEIAREARRALPASGLAVYLEARALAAAGRASELNVVLKDLEAYRENADSLGSYLSLLARELETSGDTIAARLLHARAVEWFGTLPAVERESSAQQLALGVALYRSGRYAEAKPIFEQLVRDPARNGRIPNSDPHAYLGAVYAYMGDRARADSVIEALLSDDRPGANPTALFWSARIATALGDKERAVGYLRRQLVLTGRGLSTHWDSRDLDPLVTYPPYLALLKSTEQPALSAGPSLLNPR